MKATNTQLECWDGQVRISLSVGSKCSVFWVKFPKSTQLQKGKYSKMRFLFRRVPSAGRRGTPATISLNASHGGTGDSETLHWRGTIFTILLLLTFTLLSLCHCISRFKGQDLFDCAQRINSFRDMFPKSH